MRGMRGESEYWFNYFNCKMLQKHLMSKKAPVYRKVQLFPDKIDSKDPPHRCRAQGVPS